MPIVPIGANARPAVTTEQPQARNHILMNIVTVHQPRPACRVRVIALHCSGAGASQWYRLADRCAAPAVAHPDPGQRSLAQQRGRQKAVSLLARSSLSGAPASAWRRGSLEPIATQQFMSLPTDGERR